MSSHYRGKKYVLTFVFTFLKILVNEILLNFRLSWCMKYKAAFCTLQSVLLFEKYNKYALLSLVQSRFAHTPTAIVRDKIVRKVISHPHFPLAVVRLSTPITKIHWLYKFNIYIYLCVCVCVCVCVYIYIYIYIYIRYTGLFFYSL